jgi:predicted DNA repair protein MutK
MHILEIIPHTIHEWGAAIGHSAGAAAGAVEWLVSALGGAVPALIVGGIIVAVVRQFTKHPEELIVD